MYGTLPVDMGDATLRPRTARHRHCPDIFCRNVFVCRAHCIIAEELAVEWTLIVGTEDNESPRDRNAYASWYDKQWGIFRRRARHVARRVRRFWLAGVRYFKLDEAAFLAIDAFDGVIDYNSPNTEFFHDVEMENKLVGFQLGLNLDWCLTKWFLIDAGTKFGVYGNRMNQYQRIYNLNGPAYVDVANPQDFTIDNSKDDVAFLGEIRAGVGVRVCKNARLTGGYRAVALSGVALPIDQLHSGRTGGDLTHVGYIDNDNSLILHGAYAGAEFAW